MKFYLINSRIPVVYLEVKKGGVWWKSLNPLLQTWESPFFVYDMVRHGWSRDLSDDATIVEITREQFFDLVGDLAKQLPIGEK